MAWEQREGSGAMFRNDKQGNEKAPDYKGDALFEGKKVQLAGWIREGKNGKFMSIKIEAARQPNRASDNERAQAKGEMADDIPW